MAVDGMSKQVTPGDKVGDIDDYTPGSGVYARKNALYSSLVGVTQVAKAAGKPVISVVRDVETTYIPEIGSVVTGKVTKVNTRYATVSILCVGGHPVKEQFTGIIRVQDVRAYDVDKVEIYSSFRPGDVVNTEVISLGDSRSYYLSTAKNELGVVFAESMAGHTMIPISWQEMQCPKTKMKEKRKVAKLLDDVGNE
eukprot:GFYU01007119.1.p1 GENE.GFYU01007119.1~~GFYU01007119.1.p1  ORF type:complete len:196 (-),score=46.48 GFYU01007119.1:155-742(-)